MRGAKVSVTKYQFLQQLLALELRDQTPGTLHRSLEKPAEPLSASTVWGFFCRLPVVYGIMLFDRTGVFETGDMSAVNREDGKGVCCYGIDACGWKQKYTIGSRLCSFIIFYIQLVAAADI